VFTTSCKPWRCSRDVRCSSNERAARTTSRNFPMRDISPQYPRPQHTHRPGATSAPSDAAHITLPYQSIALPLCPQRAPSFLHFICKHGQHNCHQRQRDGKGSTLHGAANCAIKERHCATLHAYAPDTRSLGLCLQVSRIGRGPGADAPFHTCAARRAANRLCSSMPTPDRRHAFLKEQEAW